jgi:hypothetical protein
VPLCVCLFLYVLRLDLVGLEVCLSVSLCVCLFLFVSSFFVRVHGA